MAQSGQGCALATKEDKGYAANSFIGDIIAYKYGQYAQKNYFAATVPGELTNDTALRFDVKEFDHKQKMEVIQGHKTSETVSVWLKDKPEDVDFHDSLARKWFMGKDNNKVYRSGQRVGSQGGIEFPLSLYGSFDIDTPLIYRKMFLEGDKVALYQTDSKGDKLTCRMLSR